MNVLEIKANAKFDGWLLVRESAKKTSQNGKCFLDLVLADKTGMVSAKVWDWSFSDEPPASGTILKILGVGNEFNGRLQLKVDSLQSAKPEDKVSLDDFVPSAPEAPRAMLNEVLVTVASIQDESIRNIVGEMIKEANLDGKLLTFPAAKQLHHAERGGLLHHLTGMLRAAKALLGVYDYLNADLLYAGVILHDLGKLDEMETDVTGLAADYSTDGRLVGHIVRGAINIERAAERVGADHAQAVLLEHLVLSHHGKLEFGSPVLPKFPEAEVLSLLDVLDARLFEMREALNGIEPGGFSAKVWALDGREVFRVPSTNGMDQQQHELG